MSLSELRNAWAIDIEPELERSGHDLDERPSYEDLVETGHSGIAYALREHHDMTLSEFLSEVGYEETGSVGSYPWGFDAETTIDELESYLESVRRRQNLAESSLASKRSRLATYARTYRDIHGEAELVERVADLDEESTEIQRVLTVFDELDAELETDASKLRYHSDVNQFYKHLQRRAKAEFNPVAHITDEFGWERDDPDNQPLRREQVRDLYHACEGPSEELTILALCAWGLRRNEVASLHVSQLVLDTEDPHIQFDERKNGPGSVALIYGVNELADRIDSLGARDREWNGYVFASRRSESGHIVGDTVQSRFQRIAERAGVKVLGESPTSKMGRRFWYTTYLEATKQLAKQLQPIASDQGSRDESVIARNYLSEAERREYRRQFMREKLADAFE